jgi:hypothetical protein
MVQLEQLKRMGPMEPVDAKPVPCGEKIMAFIAVGKTLLTYRSPSDSDVTQVYGKLPVIWYQGI